MNRQVAVAPESSQRWPGSWQLLEFWAVGSYTPLSVWVVSSEGASLSTAILFGLAVAMFGIGIVLVLTRLGLRMVSSTNAVAAVLLMMSISGSLIERFPMGRITLVAMAIVVALILYRLSGMAAVSFIVTWIVFALLVLPWVGLIGTKVGDRELTLEVSGASYPIQSRGDVVVVVFDAYAGSSTLSSEFGFDNSSISDTLRELGFTVFDDIPVNYSHTTISVPSFLQLEYVAEEGRLTDADIDALQEMMGGSNVVARSLRDSGYQAIYVESGWLGTKCTADVDVCVEGPWPGETFFDIIHRTIFRDAPGVETGVLFSRGAANAVSWSRDELPGILANEDLEYVYIHLLLPHPPFFFDTECDRDPDPSLSGFTLSWPGMGPQHLKARKQAYVAQVQCANRVMSDLAALAVETGSTLVMIGDHGPDSQNQLFLDAAGWTQPLISERMRTFAAVYSPGCELVLATSLVTLGPAVLSCLGADAPVEAANRLFIVERPDDSVNLVEILPLGS